MLISHRFSFLCGYMVTTVTVTVFLWTLGLVGGCIKVRREKA